MALAAAAGAFSAAAASARDVDSLDYTPSLHCDPVLSVIRVGTSFGLNAGITEVLKNTVREMRPDRSSDNSFPSRHTSWAYALASIASNELYTYSPWWPLGFHAASAAVGLQRTWTNRHYPSDVLAGAAIGIGSAALGSWLGQLFYSGRLYSIWPDGVSDEFRASLDVASEAIFPVSFNRSPDGGVSTHMRTGYGAALSLTLPVSSRFGFMAVARMQSFADYDSWVEPDGSGGVEVYSGAADLMAFSLGGVCRLTREGVSPFALDYGLTAGVGHVFDSAYSSASFVLATGLSASWRVTSGFAIGAKAGYQLTTLPEAMSALTMSIFTRAIF